MFLAVTCAALCLAAAPEPFRPRPELGAPELAALLWERSPELRRERAALPQAESAERRSALLPNPGLDLSVGTLPVGPTNPEGLNRLTQVPNATVSLSTLIEVGKRAPRQTQRQAELRAARLRLAALLQGLAWEALDGLSELATAQLRVAELEGLLADASRLTTLARERTRLGESAGLDDLRAGLDEERYRGLLEGEQQRVAGELAQCAELLGSGCEPFDGVEAARAFLGHRLMPAGEARPETLPELQALEAEREAREAEGRLAAATALPDPTVHVGFTHDRFLISGNQLNSFSLGVGIPLPLFDRGQPEQRAAESAASDLRIARTIQLDRASRSLSELDGLSQRSAQRLARLEQQVLPRAGELVSRLEEATRRGASPLPDLLLARRNLGELRLERHDLALASARLAGRRARLAGPLSPLPPELAP